MKKYRVQVKFEFEDEIEVYADDPIQANEKALAQLSGDYVVYSNLSEDYLDFDDVYAYDPEEVS